MSEPRKYPLADAIGRNVAAFEQIGKALREAGQSLAQATAGLESARTQARKLVLDAAATGMPEAEVARETGVTRQTVRDWIGKPKRGDIVTAEPYYDEAPGEPGHTGSITGPYVPRTDHLGAAPPGDAAWVDDGSDQGPMMVKAATIKTVGKA